MQAASPRQKIRKAKPAPSGRDEEVNEETLSSPPLLLREKRQHILFAGVMNLNTNLTTLGSRLGFCYFFSSSGIVHWSRADDRAIEEVVVRADESVFNRSKGTGKF